MVSLGPKMAQNGPKRPKLAIFENHDFCRFWPSGMFGCVWGCLKSFESIFNYDYLGMENVILGVCMACEARGEKMLERSAAEVRSEPS